MIGRTAVMIVLGLSLSACAGGDRGLRDLRSPSGGPDEFSVLPLAPLSLPDDLSDLPRPTPGGANRTDPAPQAEAVAALGGSLSAVDTAGIPASDAALVNAAGRAGTDPGIRATLATEDDAFRNRRARLGLFAGPERYFRAYAGQALDAYAELARFRNLGVAVPSAPPAP
ncbi:MAG: Beta-barrel assembly machine subunit BamF [Rhodobacteraceae bacterium HLUCCA08]|nr:MAG: Beta-barrel assembly machine subunit BamF [Rhodobacteraceae bacterium HLUCCA08]